MDGTATETQPRPAGERSTGDLVKQLCEQVSALVRDELKLAQREMTRKGRQAGAGIGMLGKSRPQKATPLVPQEAVGNIKTDVEEIRERTRR